MGKIDYGTLLSWSRSAGTQAEDAVETSSVRTFGTDEGFQVSDVWIYPPFDADGNLENLTVQISVDGQIVDLIHIHSDTAPPYLSNSKWISIPLGDRLSNNPLLNTCLKGNKKLQIRTIGGKGGVTGDYIIKLIGDYFSGDDAVARRFGATFNPVAATFYDAIRNKSISVYRPVASTIANLSNMSGGSVKAAKPLVMPYITFAWNSAATTPNTAYAYALDQSHVSKDWEDMKWDLDAKTALILERIGVKEVEHSKELWVKIGDVDYPQGDPTNAPHFDIGYDTNELPFSNYDTEQPPRKVFDAGLLIHNEIGEIRVLDDGTSIPANSLLVGVWGKKIELA